MGSSKNGCGCGGSNGTGLSSVARASVLQQTPSITACTQEVTAEVCAQATVTLTPKVEALTPVVTCINGPLINTNCEDVEGFTPFNNNGSCQFTVSQVICVTIPLDFFVDVDAFQSGGACGEVVAGNVCPSNL
ncbi:hypothetical protein [Jeotgalibacillus aurantiacus]|uniref:hypothetical protein n=1 Tax=Jeotgalibacillus aurantiacus TaxID=2763266 RepID=UPI001D0B0E16|nr:hypothetical protein [Jeotgalibacillus aurantiacus]